MADVAVDESNATTKPVEPSLQNFVNIQATTIPAVRPKGGLLYLYEWSDRKKKNDWRKDGYRWRQGGNAKFEDGGKKVYFYSVVGREGKGDTVTSNEFMRVAHYHPLHPNKVLIHYKGNETVAVDLCHGNARKRSKTERPFVANFESLKRDIASEEGQGNPSEIFGKYVIDAPAETPAEQHAIATPRDSQQVRNILRNAATKNRMSRQVFCNVMSMARDLKFIHWMSVFPDVTLFGYSDHLLSKFKKLINRKDLPSLLLTYNTTFNVGDYNCSVLNFAETEFKSPSDYPTDTGPIIPLMYMLHEKETDEAHHFFWESVIKNVPEIKEATNVLVVADNEKSIVGVIETKLPSVGVFRCWHHVQQNAKWFLRSLGIRKKEILTKYRGEVSQLLEAPTKDEYKDRLIALSTTWPERFYKHVCGYLHEDIDRIGLWSLKKYGFESITNKQAESISALIKRFQEWKDAPLDSMILGLHRIFQYYNAKIVRGWYRQGEYQLRDHLHNYYTSESNGSVLSDLPSSAALVESIKKTTEGAVDAIEEPESGFDPNASFERAVDIWRRGGVSLNAENAKFTVEDVEESTYLVTLFPQTTCSCGAKTVCCHISAAQLAIGLQNERSKRRPSAPFQRKKPRKIYEEEPAEERQIIRPPVNDERHHSKRFKLADHEYTFDSAIRLSTDSEGNEDESSRTIILVDFDGEPEADSDPHCKLADDRSHFGEPVVCIMESSTMLQEIEVTETEHISLPENDS